MLMPSTTYVARATILFFSKLFWSCSPSINHIPTQKGRTKKYIKAPWLFVILNAVSPDTAMTTPFGFIHWKRHACTKVKGLSTEELSLFMSNEVVAIL